MPSVRNPRHRTARPLAALVASTFLVLAGCSDDGGGSGSATTSDDPSVSTTAAGSGSPTTEAVESLATWSEAADAICSDYRTTIASSTVPGTLIATEGSTSTSSVNPAAITVIEDARDAELDALAAIDVPAGSEELVAAFLADLSYVHMLMGPDRDNAVAPVGRRDTDDVRIHLVGLPGDPATESQMVESGDLVVEIDALGVESCNFFGATGTYGGPADLVLANPGEWITSFADSAADLQPELADWISAGMLTPEGASCIAEAIAPEVWAMSAGPGESAALLNLIYEHGQTCEPAAFP